MECLSQQRDFKLVKEAWGLGDTGISVPKGLILFIEKRHHTHMKDWARKGGPFPLMVYYSQRVDLTQEH